MNNMHYHEDFENRFIQWYGHIEVVSAQLINGNFTMETLPGNEVKEDWKMVITSK